MGEEHASEEIAAALEAIEDLDVSYELMPMGTIIEAETAADVFEAAEAAHEALNDERLITRVEIDEIPGRDLRAADRVESVGRALGRPPKG